MSLEATVAAFVAQANALLSLPQQVADAATAGVGRIDAAFTASARNVVAVYVNAAIGVDSAARSGGVGQPLATINAAVERVPVGGVGYIYLAAPITISVSVPIRGRTIMLFSSSATRHEVSFQRTTSAGLYRTMAGFSMEAGGHLLISGLSIQVPSVAGFEGFGLWGSSALVQVQNDPLTTLLYFCLLGCDLNLPASPFGPLLAHTGPMALRLVNCVMTGSPLTGRVHAVQTNTTTAQPTSNHRYILTNLTEF
jgi:hypothetical protein